MQSSLVRPPITPLLTTAALGTMIEFVNVTEDTFKRSAYVEILLIIASRTRFMRWIKM